ncbi:hypothetical protein LJR230_002316 [Trinickia sp. LjRoot230]|uniref:hypothetical protein n=1 Tax=Trinickia sp. LjRoot230 TaxID=3342288 RepID=UPI003ECFB6A6
MSINPAGSNPDRSSAERLPEGEQPPSDSTMPADTAPGSSRASFGLDLPTREPSDVTRPTSTRATFREKPRDEKLLEFLDELARGPVVSSMPGRPITHLKSLETIARDSGVSVEELEGYIRSEMSAFCERVGTGASINSVEYQSLVDKLYNLFVLVGNAESSAWLGHMRNFDSFVDHFCPQADLDSKRRLVDCVTSFVQICVLPMELYRPDLRLRGGDAAMPAYADPGNWVRLQFEAAWVNLSVIEEAQRWAGEGLAKYENLLVHGTGSAAMQNFAKNGAIWSAAIAIQHGDKLVTGEYAYSPSQQSEASRVDRRRDRHVYTARDGMNSRRYTTQRWFDEAPVTFGISEKAQREYNRAQGLDRVHTDKGDEVLIGPAVPLENVVAIAAPKAREETMRSWIEAHCRNAQFISYEAADLLKYAGKHHGEQGTTTQRRGGFGGDAHLL